MINRDGQKASLWQETVNPFESNYSERTGVVYDVIIAGGGITGISTGLLLQREGLQCLVLEAETLCFGTTGGTTAHLNTLLDTPYTIISKNFGEENAVRVAGAVKNAITLIHDNIKQYGIECGFSYADACLFATEEKQLKELNKVSEATASAGLDVSWTTTTGLPVPFLKAIRVGAQARFSPAAYVYGIAREFEKAGGDIIQQCRITGAENGEPVEVTTAKGKFRGRKLIYATHVPPGLNLLHLRCAPYRSYATAFTVSDGNYPETLSYDMYDPYHYYRSQEINGKKFLIAGGYDHKTGHEENTEKCFSELIAHCHKYFPVEKVHYTWSSQYFEPADGLPYIGHLPGERDNIFVATGFGGNGMTYSQVAAMLLKNLVTGKEDELQELFSPNRVKPIAGFTNFIGHNADVIRQFAGQWFSNEKLQEIAGLAAGEGKVMTYEGHKLGLYKDETGKIHAVNPLCTHMKCQVQWNMSEKSWDCPCHGARYSPDGLILTGPSTRPLEKIDITKL